MAPASAIALVVVAIATPSKTSFEVSAMFTV
jgi:hypothetical protein